jgi:hypothetical protein
VDVSHAEQVGKQSRDNVEMWSNSPRITAATAQPRATMWRMNV